jgi:PAS domain S-box-containing protein
LMPPFINFVFSYAEKERTIKNFITVLFITGGFILFLYLWWNTNLIHIYGFSNAVSTPWGPVTPIGRLQPLALIYFFINFSYGAFLLISYYKKLTEPVRKKQALLVVIACCLPFVSDLFFQGLLPLFGLKAFPATAVSMNVMFALIVYAIYKYRLFYVDNQILAENLIRFLPLLFFVVDKKGYVTSVNKVIAQFGLKQADVIGQSVSNFLEISKNLQNFLQKANDSKYREESNFIREGKVILPVEINANDLIDNGEKIGTLLLINDLSSAKYSLKSLAENFETIQNQNKEMRDTKLAMLNLMGDLEQEKKQVEIKVEERTKELKEESMLLESQNLLFESFITNLPIGALLVDVKTNTVVLANDLVIAIFELKSAAKIKNKKFYGLVRLCREDGTEYSDSERAMSRAIRTGESITEQVFFHRSSGELQPLRVHVAPVKDHAGAVVSAIALVEDITEEFKIDKTKTEFVSLASHQLRTPLSSVNWYTEMLLTGDAGDMNAEQKDFLEEISKGAHHMADLVTILLDVSRIDMGTFVIDPEIFDICGLMDSEIEQLKLQLEEKSLNLKFECEVKKKKLNVDAQAFSIIMQNLLTNAIKYTPAKGKIKVGLSEDKKTDSCVISVADTGYGIPKNQQDKMFGKLFRADNIKTKEIDGNGLGLYLVKSIVESAGCKIWFESEEKRGTTFYVSIPNAGMKQKAGAHKLGELKS